MNPLTLTYLLFTGTSALAGLTMVGLAVRAYQQTQRQSMFHLSVGFTLIVAATITTALSGMLSAFQAPQVLLSVQYGLLTIGFLFIIYSILVD